MKKIYLLAVIVSALFFKAVNAQEIVNVKNTDVTAKRAYLVKPGDKIEGKVLGEDQFNFTTTIDDDGYFEVPFVEEPILARCKSEKNLREEVRNHLAKYLRRPLVSVQVLERRKPAPVIVAGEVRQPGPVDLTRETRLLELISFAQGETEGSGGIVRVLRSRPELCADAKTVASWNAESDNGNVTPTTMYSMSSVIKGMKEANPIINHGDIIFVEKANAVYINGEVNSKTGVYIKEGGLSLTQALAMVGGVRERAQTKDIKIYRKIPNSQDRETISVNLELIQSKEAKDVMLQPLDIIDVAKKKKSIGEVMLEIATGAARTTAQTFASSGTRVLY